MRVIVILVLMLAMLPCFSFADSYMKIEGVEGESSAWGRQGEIDIPSWSWGESRTCDFRARPDFKPIVVTKQVDKSSPKLAEACAAGRIFEEGKIESLRAFGDGEMKVYYQVKFSDVLVTSYQTGGSSGGNPIPTEEISLCFGGVRLTYLLYDSEGRLQEVITEGFATIEDGTIPSPDDFPIGTLIVDSFSITGPSGDVQRITAEGISE